MSLPKEETSEHLDQKWWKEATIYEIYPASFKDSNADGIGDIPGIISKLDYLHDLGVDVIHICPHYQSPQVDMGYDISDYEKIHAPYGTVEDVQSLIDGAHAKEMKIIFDLVINHSSNLHPWFLASRSSKEKDNEKRDWYFWLPPKIDEQGNRHPPNNWRSHFSVPAWTWDETRQEYYLHVYAPEMPDLNWENEETRNAIYNSSMIFWLDRGIDGFRIDTVNKYSKDISFPDAKVTEPGEETQPAAKHYNHGPRIHEFLGEMKGIFQRYGAMTVGELSHLPRSEKSVLEFVSADSGPLDMVFNLNIGSLGRGGSKGQKNELAPPPPFEVELFVKEMSRWQDFVSNNPDAWITLYLENHDSPRSISRFGATPDSSLDIQFRSGKMLAMALATLTGTLFLYQGQEIGMSNVPRLWPPEELKDIRSKNLYELAKERCKGDEQCLEKAVDALWETARDHARLPMQWDGEHGPNSGFTSEGVVPWMRVNDDWEEKNVKNQKEDQDSLLEFWKLMIKLRREYKNLFIYGGYELVETDEKEVFVFFKIGERLKSLTVVNMSSEEKRWQGAKSTLGENYELLIRNVESARLEDDVLVAWEGRVYLKRF
ncbi:hypothetical protein G7Y89_g2464 [Cudoniella acicularis]|uniref:Glycosyl hydrolase family 13 catalytic domain-containing protein n=1 Tax=Cudoniella acicularis TaxID=354080 RepID=A0A8H4RV19_9HELO|nr:hypothetical protein G7Y89_g2464 [Cudoniella acicularis]